MRQLHGKRPNRFSRYSKSRCCGPTGQPAGAASGDCPILQPVVKVSGFDISGMRVSYSPYDDTFSIGLDQPQSLNHPGEVIAGDADNNGNSGTVNPAVTSTPGFAGFQDPADFGGTEHMGAAYRLHRQRQRPDRVPLLGRAYHSHPERPQPPKAR